MRLFVTGATGLIGRRLVLDRLVRGDDLVVLSRDRGRALDVLAADGAAAADAPLEVIEGDPSVPGAWQRAVDGCDAVVHLAGAGLADHRWTAAYKETIARSRIDGTFQVVEAIRAAQRRPGVLVGASAVGWYGDTGATPTDEKGPPAADDFIGDLCRRWEEQAAKAEEFAARVVHLRTGLVLDERGGLLASLRRPFLAFVGGPIGAGRQYMPWVHWRDEVGLIDLALRDASLRGPLNAVAPEPVTNRVFSRALGRALRRPSWLPVPPFALRLVLGEFAHYAVMSQRIIPGVAGQRGYRFEYPSIDTALEALLGGSAEQRAAPAPSVAPPVAAGPHESARPPARVRLVLLPVDGALLRSDGRLPQGVARACGATAEAGVAIVLATARPPRSARPIVASLGLAQPVICYNGALIWHPSDDTRWHHEPLEPSLAADVIAAARAAQPRITVGIEIADRWYSDRLESDLATKSGGPLVPDEIGPLDRFLVEPVTQINLLGAAPDIAAARAAIAERFWRRRLVSLQQPEPTLLQVAHPLVDKGIAVQRIARRLGLQRQEVMAVGCGTNDMGMLEWAGFAVAMGNAKPPVKALADAVVEGNDDLGVAGALQRYVLETAEDARTGRASSG